jgi:hypothetical protein
MRVAANSPATDEEVAPTPAARSGGGGAKEGQAEVVLVGCGAPNRGMGWYHAVQMLEGRCVAFRARREPPFSFFLRRRRLILVFHSIVGGGGRGRVRARAHRDEKIGRRCPAGPGGVVPGRVRRRRRRRPPRVCVFLPRPRTSVAPLLALYLTLTHPPPNCFFSARRAARARTHLSLFLPPPPRASTPALAISPRTTTPSFFPSRAYHRSRHTDPNRRRGRRPP